MKFLFSGILVGAFVVTAGVVLAEQVRRQRKIEDVADLADRLASQLEALEHDLAEGRELKVPARVKPTNGVARKKSPRSSTRPTQG